MNTVASTKGCVIASVWIIASQITLLKCFNITALSSVLLLLMAFLDGVHILTVTPPKVCNEGQTQECAE